MPRFCATTHEGKPCSALALPGRPFCAAHNVPLPMRQCAHIKKTGAQCRSGVFHGGHYCYAHDPRRPAAHRQAPRLPAPGVSAAPSPIGPTLADQTPQPIWLVVIYMPQPERTSHEPVLIQ